VIEPRRVARWAALGAVASIIACSPPIDHHFPDGFLFGAAIAGFQVEMGCPTIGAATCEDPHSDWYKWITDPALRAEPGNHLEGDPPSSGPGFYELYPADLDRLANELHGNALRTSIEWSRLFPHSTVGINGYDALHAAANPEALRYYHALFAAGSTPIPPSMRSPNMPASARRSSGARSIGGRRSTSRSPRSSCRGISCRRRSGAVLPA
jgi:hypothetical protein